MNESNEPKEHAIAPLTGASSVQSTAGFTNSSNHGWQLGQNLGTINYFAGGEKPDVESEPSNVDDDELSLPFGLFRVSMVDSFIGRDEELREINTAFENSDGKRKVVVLHGLGGIGKTQLAAFWARENSSKYPAVVWLDGNDGDSLDKSFVVAAQRLQAEHPQSAALIRILELSNPADVARAMSQWLSVGKNKRWLLIFDNVDNPRLSSNPDGVYDLKDYFPVADHGHIMVTSRLSDLDIGKCVPIKQLTDVQQSLAVLVSASRRYDAYKDPDAEALVRRLGGLPLALSSAGAFLRQTSISFAKYLESYEQSWHKVQNMSRTLTYQDKTLRTTWNLSLDRVNRIDPTAAELLRIWGGFDNQDLWYALIAKGQLRTEIQSLATIESELDFHMMMKVLCDHSLAEATQGSDGYSCHPCVHDWIRNTLNAEQRSAVETFSLLAVGFLVPKSSTERFWEIQRRLLSHANRLSLTFLEDSTDYDEDTSRAVHNLGIFYHDQGKTDQEEAMKRWALAAKEHTYGMDDTSTLYAVNSLAIACTGQDKFDEAEKLYQRVLSTLEKTNHMDDVLLFGTMNNLGTLYRTQGRLDEAEIMLQRAIAGKEKSQSFDYVSTLDTVVNLGALFKDQGRLDKAEEAYQRALAGQEAALGPNHPTTLRTLSDLGNLYARQEKFDEAEAILKRAIVGHERIYGREHFLTVDMMYDLAEVYILQDCFSKAEEIIRPALAITERTEGPDHVRTLDIIQHLGELYAYRSQYDEAETMCQRALAGYEKKLGPNHSNTLGVVVSLGVVYHDQKRYDEAERMWQRALGKEEPSDSKRDFVLRAAYNLGSLYASQNRTDEA